MLEERILYDDDRVFDRLHINDNSADFIEACTTSVQHCCGNSIGTLKRLCEAAESRREDCLEQEEREDTSTTKRGANEGSKEEMLMYGPLSLLFSHITYFTFSGQKDHHDAPQRVLKMANHLGKPREPHTAGMPTASTDFTGIKHDADPNFSSWSDLDFFAEVKPSSKQGPKVSPGGIPRILVKCAEYACLFMDGRPFMLFCTGLLIFGTRFCVGMFDRDGIILSPVHDMFDDLEVFVAVVRTLTHRASIIDLGLDPSVHVLSLAKSRELTKEEGPTEFPSALVPVGGALWCTIGPPIHVPQSLFGGGTHAWRVRRYDRRERELCGPVMVMKTTWRRGGRRTESDVYEYIRRTGPLIHGLSVFEMGGDVTFPNSVNVISISALRRPFTSNNVPSVGATLHRLVLKSVGIPMWEYEFDKQLLNAFRDVVQAHELLCERGILHRDINPGNILLNIEQNTPRQGILVDLDSASLFSSAANISSTQHIGDRHRQDFVFETENDVKSGLSKPGTTQFMARELLVEETDRHEVKHDIESFIWAFSYCVWRKVLQSLRNAYATSKSNDDLKTLKFVQQHYDACFSQTRPRKIAAYRSSVSDTIRFYSQLRFKTIVETFMTPSLVSLFKAFCGMLNASESDLNPVPLTHKILLDAVNQAILE